MLVTRGPKLVRATLIFASIAAATFSLMGFWVKPWGDHPKYQMVSQYLDTHTTIADHIFVWGHMPEIYWASDRRPASRFITSGFLVGDWGSRPPGDTSTNVPTPGALEQLMDDLRAHPPRYVLDTTPAAFRGSQFTPMSKYPELQHYVDARLRVHRDDRRHLDLQGADPRAGDRPALTDRASACRGARSVPGSAGSVNGPAARGAIRSRPRAGAAATSSRARFDIEIGLHFA